MRKTRFEAPNATRLEVLGPVEWPEAYRACFCLRVDIDTVRDAKSLPMVLEVLDALDVRATIFVATGRDECGRGLLSALGRSLRGRYLRRYGFDALRGLLLPQLNVEESIGDWRRVLAQGGEIALHGYWHRNWLSKAHEWGFEDAKRNIEEGLRLFSRRFDRKPRGFSAPGFVVSPNVLLALESFGFAYTGNYRVEGGGPMRVEVGGRGLNYVEMPVTSNNMEEYVLGGLGKERAMEVVEGEVKGALEANGYSCYYVHPSFEAHVERHLRRLLTEVIDDGVWTPTLGEASEWCRRQFADVFEPV